MECCSRCRAIPALEASPATAVRSQGFALRRSTLTAAGSRRPAGIAAVFQGTVRNCRNRCLLKQRAPAFVTVASAESKKCEFWCVGTPLEPQSPAGRFLSGILKNLPHFFPMAASEQLQVLALERDGAIARRDRSLGTSESCLHGRIAEMKEQACELAIEEVMYMLIVQKFSEIKVPMVLRLSKCMSGSLDIWPSKDVELESIHSSDVLEMVREHLSNILGRTGTLGITVNMSTAQIKRLQLGQIYAASIMFGYFLKSVNLRHRLELNLALTSKNYAFSYLNCVMHTNLPLREPDQNFITIGCPSNAVPSLYPGMQKARKAKKLRSYVMGFDSNTLQICAKLRSQEAVNLIEKHSWALFGDHEGMNVEDDEVVSISFSGVKRLVLEAVAIGSFLWDVEGYVDSVYRLKENRLEM